MPAAAVAKGKKATYHSHTEAVERRDDCSRVYQSALGLTLEIMTEGNPAFRWDGAYPEYGLSRAIVSLEPCPRR
jgi:hypothetical protein